MHHRFFTLFALCLAVFHINGAAAEETPSIPAPKNQWESTIQAFELADQKAFPAKRAVLFVGSSSIFYWKDLETVFAPVKTINRGFGGSWIKDSTFFADRIIRPYRPRMVVLYAGDNDIASGRKPDETLDDFKQFTRTVRKGLPRVKIAFISIKPSPARWRFTPQILEANQKIKEYISRERRMVYIDVYTPMLGDDGKPRPELYVSDQLHMSREGYTLWEKIIGPYLK